MKGFFFKVFLGVLLVAYIAFNIKACKEDTGYSTLEMYGPRH